MKLSLLNLCILKSLITHIRVTFITMSLKLAFAGFVIDIWAYKGSWLWHSKMTPGESRIASTIASWSLVAKCANCHLQVANCHLQVANCHLRVANCHLVANCHFSKIGKMAIYHFSKSAKRRMVVNRKANPNRWKKAKAKHEEKVSKCKSWLATE